jgi:hypothetical protein
VDPSVRLYRPDTRPTIYRPDLPSCVLDAPVICRKRLYTSFEDVPEDIDQICSSSFHDTLLGCYKFYGCQNIPDDLYDYCFHELKCHRFQCLINGARMAASVSLIVVVLVTAVVTMLALRP